MFFTLLAKVDIIQILIQNDLKRYIYLYKGIQLSHLQILLVEIAAYQVDKIDILVILKLVGSLEIKVLYFNIQLEDISNQMVKYLIGVYIYKGIDIQIVVVQSLVDNYTSLFIDKGFTKVLDNKLIYVYLKLSQEEIILYKYKVYL